MQFIVILPTFQFLKKIVLKEKSLFFQKINVAEGVEKLYLFSRLLRQIAENFMVTFFKFRNALGPYSTETLTNEGQWVDEIPSILQARADNKKVQCRFNKKKRASVSTNSELLWADSESFFATFWSTTQSREICQNVV